jgi:cytosine/uracil/thiamine/allantoin permease
VFPEPIRIVPLLALPVLIVVGLMFYWLARVLFTQQHRHAVRHLSIESRA